MNFFFFLGIPARLHLGPHWSFGEILLEDGLRRGGGIVSGVTGRLVEGRVLRRLWYLDQDPVKPLDLSGNFSFDYIPMVGRSH